jgi:sugar phosphate isomerase/epimerase
MKLAIFASHLRALSAAGMDFPAALAWAKEHGIEAVEADTGEFNAMPPDEYRSVLDKAGMRMISAHHLCRLSAADEGIYEDEIAGCIRAAEQSKKAGSDFLMLVPANLCDIPDGAAKVSARERIINGMKRVSETVTPIGITLTIENFSKTLFPFSTAAELCDMADNVPSLRLTLDSGNFRCIAGDVLGGYEAIKNRLAFCHIKDWNIIADGGLGATDGVHLRGCLLGHGVVPIGDLMFRLKTDGYRGWLVIEQESAGGEVMAEYIETAVHVLSAYK